MIQSGNWRGARDPARELEGARDAGTHEKNCCTGLVPAKSTGTQPEPVSAQISPERNQNSGRVLK